MPLPTNIDATYPDDPARPDRKLHQQYHDALHDQYNDYEGTGPADFDVAGAAAAEEARALAAEATKATPAQITAAIAALGLGTASTEDVSAFDSAGTAASAIAALGLGTASTQPISAFDPSGAAAAAQAAAVQRDNHVGTQAQATVTNLVSDLAAKADLVGGSVPTAQLPSITITDTFIVGDEAEMLALDVERGDVAIRQDISKSFILATDSPSTLVDWKELLSPADGVTSVNGRVGSVTGLAENTALTAEVSRATAAEALAAEKAANLSDLTSPSAARTSLGLGTAAVADKVAAGVAGVLDATDASTTDARTPIGDATGDLSGSYPSPTVAKVNGVTITGVPDVGQVVTATDATTAMWQFPAAAEGSSSAASRLYTRMAMR